MTDTKSQTQEAQENTNRINTKKIYTEAYHIQTTESLRQRKFLKEAQKRMRFQLRILRCHWSQIPGRCGLRLDLLFLPRSFPTHKKFRSVMCRNSCLPHHAPFTSSASSFACPSLAKSKFSGCAEESCQVWKALVVFEQTVLGVMTRSDGHGLWRVYNLDLTDSMQRAWLEGAQNGFSAESGQLW